MEKLQKSEDITSKEFLDNALENAKSWCRADLPKHLHGFHWFDYSIFRYVIDNTGFFDMRLDEQSPGLIRVSTKKLEWYVNRECYVKEYGGMEPETDPESMFVHEIAEFVILASPAIFVHYFLIGKTPHHVARQIENLNRLERDLMCWYIP